MRRGPRKFSQRIPEPKVGRAIAAPELRVLDEAGGNLGVLSREDALAKAESLGLELIEITPNANPPVARIMDYGKYRYEAKRKARDVRAQARESETETKVVQIKIGTGENDLALKARRASEWLAEGHRVKVELYLRGRSKYLDKEFLAGRLTRFEARITTPFKVAEGNKASPKGIALTLERDKNATVANVADDTGQMTPQKQNTTL